MKTPVLPLAGLLAALSLLATPATHAEVSAISIHVEASSKTELNKDDRYTKTQAHSLKVQVTNSGKEPADINVKYIFFGRDVKAHNIDKINEGEKTAQIKPLATDVVDIPAVTSSYTDEHYDMPGGGGAGGGKGGGKNVKPGKKVEASGSKFVGYAVQVFQKDKMVAEAYEPASMKDEVGKAAAAPKGEDIKAKAPGAAKKK
jgi:hypothetical protein